MSTKSTKTTKSTKSTKSAEYRAKAAEYFALAGSEPVESLRRRLLAIARSFEQLADQLDRLDDLTPGSGAK